MGVVAAESRRQVRGSALLVLGRVLALVIALATQVIIVRALSKGEFGAFEYAITLAGSARILLSLGQGRLLSRFMAKYDEESDYSHMFGAMVLAVGTIVATTMPLIVALYVFPDALVGSAVQDNEAQKLVLILIFLSPLEALDQVFVSLFAVFTEPRAIFFRKYLMTPGLRFAVVLVLALTGSSVTFLAVGYLLAALAGIGLYTVLAVKVLRDRHILHEFKFHSIRLPFKAVFSFSFPLITGELSLLSMKLAGVVVLSHYHPLTEVANYRVAFGPARLNTAVTASFATLFLPTIARLHSRSQVAGLRSTYWQTAAFVAVATFPIFAMTGPLAPATTVTLFGERYAESAAVLSVLATGYYVNIVLGFNTYTLQVCGRIRWLVGVNILVAVLNVALCLAWAPSLGALGVAFAHCASLLTQNVLNQVRLRRELASGLIDRACWPCYALIVAGSLALWGLDAVASPGIVASALAASAVSLMVLAGSQRALDLGATFPELRRLPLVGRLVR